MLEKFINATEAVGSTVKRFTDIAGAVNYLKEQFGGPVAASALPASLRTCLEPLGFAKPCDYAVNRLAVSAAEAGIADTGSLLLDLEDPTERSATALAPIHAVFLRASTIVPSLANLGDILSQRLAAPGNSYLSITTGPSRTADIERVLTIGVHGAKELHILVLENE